MFTRQGDREGRGMKTKQDDQLSNTSAHSQTVSNPPAHPQTEFIKKKSKRTNCPLHKVYSNVIPTKANCNFNDR